jgi:ribosomal protein S20
MESQAVALKTRKTAKAMPRQPGAPYTKQEAAAFLRVSTKQIEDYIKRGLLKKSKAARRVMISANQVESFADRTS